MKVTHLFLPLLVLVMLSTAMPATAWWGCGTICTCSVPCSYGCIDEWSGAFTTCGAGSCWAGPGDCECRGNEYCTSGFAPLEISAAPVALPCTESEPEPEHLPRLVQDEDVQRAGVEMDRAAVPVVVGIDWHRDFPLEFVRVPKSPARE